MSNINRPIDQEKNIEVDYISIIEDIITKSPDVVINPNSILYKNAIKQFNKNIQGKSIRPNAPLWMCGADKIKYNSSDSDIDNINITPNNSNSIIINTTPIITNTDKTYRVDLCLANDALPGNDNYRLCGSTVSIDMPFSLNLTVSGSPGYVSTDNASTSGGNISVGNNSSSGNANFSKQLVFVGTQYYWHRQNADAFCKQAAQLGLNVSCEIMEMVTSGDIDIQGSNQIKLLAPWVEAARKYGIILKLSNNSNDVLNPTAKPDTLINRTKLILSLYGYDNILYQPVSENDSKLKSSIALATRNHAASVWPSNQLIDYLPYTSGANYKETHSMDQKLPKTWSSLVVTDNGTDLSDKLSEVDMYNLAARHIRSGYSFEVYGFNTSPNWSLYSRIAATIPNNTKLTASQLQGLSGPPSTPSINAPLITKHTGPDFDKISIWKGSSRPDWKQTVTISNIKCNGKSISWSEAKGQRDHWNIWGSGKAVNGETNVIIPSIKAAGCFDYLGVGQTNKTTGNLLYKSSIEPGFFAPWYPRSGEIIGFYICTINRDKGNFKMKERSNVLWFNWP